MLELEEALARILAVIPAPVAERIPLKNAHRRILAENVQAPIDLPTFDNSSVDGYAVRAADVAAATAAAPVRLRIVGRVAAGETFNGELVSGASVRLFTGSPLSRGADAIVMQEDTRLEPSRPDEVLVLEPVKPWENVRFRGEDVKRDAALMNSGEVLTVGAIALLAGLGMTHATVGRQPTVGLMATGSELKEAGESLGPGQIYESNRAAIGALVEASGAAPRMFPIVTDDLAVTRAALECGFSECDAVITCGGVSVGEMDFVKSAFEQLGGSLNFWRVAIKPGKPFVFGQLGSKFLFGLPGNPISALVTYLLMVRPALLRWQGASDLSMPIQRGVLVEPLNNPGTRRHFVRVRIDSTGEVRSAGVQASHILSSISTANGLIDVPPKMFFAAGEAVSVLRLD
jgi:molybdopterin molybdotransferase